MLKFDISVKKRITEGTVPFKLICLDIQTNTEPLFSLTQ